MLIAMPHGQIFMMPSNNIRNLGFQQDDVGEENEASKKKTIMGVAQV